MFSKIIIIFAFSLCMGQHTQLQTGWERVSIPEVGYIDIPPSLELQDIKKNPMLSLPNQNALFIQQKGLNDFKQSSFGTYVRVIIETEISGDNEYEKLDTKYYVSKKELEELDDILKPQFENPYTTIIDWFPISTIDINNIRALLIHYTRVGHSKDKYPVDVKMYKFQNYDRLHTVTVSYRIRDKYKWNSVLEDVLKSFTITNVKTPKITKSVYNPYTPEYSDFDKRRISKEKEKQENKILETPILEHSSIMLTTISHGIIR